MIKKEYEKVEVEVVIFETEDVITTSGSKSEGDIDPFGNTVSSSMTY